MIRIDNPAISIGVKPEFRPPASPPYRLPGELDPLFCGRVRDVLSPKLVDEYIPSLEW